MSMKKSVYLISWLLMKSADLDLHVHIVQKSLWNFKKSYIHRVHISLNKVVHVCFFSGFDLKDSKSLYHGLLINQSIRCNSQTHNFPGSKFGMKKQKNKHQIITVVPQVVNGV